MDIKKVSDTITEIDSKVRIEIGHVRRRAVATSTAEATATALLVQTNLPQQDVFDPLWVYNHPGEMQELENLAPGTWYVNVLAAYPEQRGKGYGAALLGLADRIAVDARNRGLSIIVADTNTGARRLYERCDYRETATRRMVKEDWQHPGTAWVLLTKPVPT